MNTLVVHVETKSDQHYTAFKALFDEYSSNLSVEIDRHIVKRLFELPYFHGFLVYLNKQPVGFAVCFESFSSYRCKTVINIHDFMVSEKVRGKGMGKVLLTGVEQYCREHDVLKITLEVDDDNTVAKRLYSACDFEDHEVELKGLLHWQKYLR